MTLPEAANSVARTPAANSAAAAGASAVVVSPGARPGVPCHADRHGLARGVLHLAGDGALPDQVVKPQLVGAQPGALRLGRGAEPVAGRPDRLVRLLGVLHLVRVGTRRVRYVLGAVQLAGLVAGGVDRGLRQRDRVGPHVGDVAVLVKPLRDGHRVLGGEAELAARLLLQRGSPERRVGRAAVRLALDARDAEGGTGFPLQPGGERRRHGAVEVQDLLLRTGVGAQLSGWREVAAGGDPLAVDRLEGRGELCRRIRQPFGAVGFRGEVGLKVPVARRAERDPLPLPVDDQAGGDRLDAARGQPRHDLLPQHRGDLVAVQPVEDAPGLVGVHLAVVELSRVRDGAGDRLGGDLVEDHPLGRHLRLELFLQVPGDGLALAVLVSGEVELVGVLEQRLELGDLLLLVGRHDVERLEVVVDVDAEPRPGLRAVLLGDFRRLVGHVTDVADARLDYVSLAEIAGDGPGLGRGLDDHQTGATTVAGPVPAGCRPVVAVP